TYNMIREQEGNKLISGLKGFGIGAAFDAGLGLPGLLGRQATRLSGGPLADEVGAGLADKVTTGQPLPSPELERTAADALKAQADVAKAEARPMWITQDENVKGVMVHVRGRQAGPMGAPERSFNVKPGDEIATVNEIMRTLDEGGTLEGISHGPDAAEPLSNLLDVLASKSRGKYEFGQKLIRTEPGAAEAVAEQMRDAGADTK